MFTCPQPTKSREQKTLDIDRILKTYNFQQIYRQFTINEFFCLKYNFNPPSTESIQYNIILTLSLALYIRLPMVKD